MRPLVFALLMPLSAYAVVPVVAPTPPFLSVPINAAPGDQYDPHVEGDVAAYTADPAIRYYRFSTAVDAAVPGGGNRDLLSDVSQGRIVFTRVFSARNALMVFDTTSATLIEIDPQPDANRVGASIGGPTVAYVDFRLHSAGEVVVHDLASNTRTRLTNDAAYDQSPSVSADGSVVVWERCATSILNCDVMKAAKGTSGWVVSTVAASNVAEANPDSNGAVTVFDANRGTVTGHDIYLSTAAGEDRLELDGTQLNPSIAQGVVVFESKASDLAPADLFLYRLQDRKLFQLTNTVFNESLNDVTVLPDGRVRVVWASDDEGINRNIYGATFALPAVVTCPNRSVSLEASVSYQPLRWTADSEAVSPTMRFAIPSALTVTKGNAGNQFAYFSFRDGSKREVTCRYRGGSKDLHPKTPTEIQKGLRYAFDGCLCTGKTRYQAGSIATATRFELFVLSADVHLPKTTATVSVGEVCTTSGAGVSQAALGADETEFEAAPLAEASPAGELEPVSLGSPDAAPAVGCSSTGANVTMWLWLMVAALLLARRPMPVAVRTRRRR